MRRRDAMKYAGAAAALFGLPPQTSATAPPLPERTLLESNPELYWKRIRDEQFLLPDWRAFLNNGSLGVAPKPVVAAVTDALTRYASLVDDVYPRWGYETLDEQRAELARFLGCAKDALALTHNATEAMSIIAAGLDLRPGDEVLITDQEHPSGRSGWLMRQARHGITVREVKIPIPPKSPDQILDVIVSAIGPRTRALSFSGIATTTGLIFPVREICTEARRRRVITVVDAAHMSGQVPMRISDFGCDFVAGSPHKWLFAPAGCGFLWVREQMLDRLWPSVVTGGWDNLELKAARFMMVGTNNRAVFDGYMAGLRFHEALGPEAVFARIHQLARTVQEKAAARPYLDMLTPPDDRMYAALVSFRLRDGDVKQLFEECRKRRIWILEGERLRIATHVHTRPSDIDAFFEVMDGLYGKRAATRQTRGLPNS